MVDYHNGIRNICHHWLVKTHQPQTPGPSPFLSRTLWAERRKAPRPFFPKVLAEHGATSANICPLAQFPRAPRGQMRHLHILTLGGWTSWKLLETGWWFSKCFKPCPKYVKSHWDWGIIIPKYGLKKCWNRKTVCFKTTAKSRCAGRGSPKFWVGFIFRHPCAC